MPYIKANKRAELDLLVNELAGKIFAYSPGELNYVFTRILQGYASQFPTYARINDAIGALEAAKLEFYRRLVAPYEDKKIAENGDVY